jgi:hypothetical protein
MQRVRSGGPHSDRRRRQFDQQFRSTPTEFDISSGLRWYL